MLYFFQANKKRGDEDEDEDKDEDNFTPKCGFHTKDGLALARVIGKSTQEGEWPHTCLMYRLNNDQRLEYFAGASLIAPGVLITAAHEVE